MGKQYQATWGRKKIIGMVYLKHFFTQLFHCYIKITDKNI